MAFKFSKLTTFSAVCILTITWSTISLAASHKKDPCLKNNNGIGNNHDVYVELPSNSQSLDDAANEIISLRIDPGNSGQVKKFTGELESQGFDSLEIDFVIAQIIDAEKKLKETLYGCLASNPPVEKDYTLLPD